MRGGGGTAGATVTGRAAQPDASSAMLAQISESGKRIKNLRRKYSLCHSEQSPHSSGKRPPVHGYHPCFRLDCQIEKFACVQFMNSRHQSDKGRVADYTPGTRSYSAIRRATEGKLPLA